MLKLMCNSIRNKLLFITGVGTTLLLLASFWGLYSAWQNEQKFIYTIDVHINNETQAQTIATDFKIQVQEWKNVLLRGHDTEKREKYWGKFNQRHDLIQQEGEALLASIEAAPIKDKLSDFLQTHQLLLASYSKGLAAFMDNDFDYRAGDKAVSGIDRRPAEQLRELATDLKQVTQAQIESSKVTSVSTVQITLVSIALALIISLSAFLIMVQKTIIKPARTLVVNLAAMAKGDFSRDIIVTSDDEIGLVASSAIKLQNDIGGFVEGINLSVFKLSTTAEEMAHNTDQLNQLMIQQRGETDQVATAMNQMTATVHEVSQNAQLAADSANQANTDVNTGQVVINDAINSISKLVQQVETAADVIHALESDSVEIGSVLDVIRSIAEQTNLLALNAAIEAARAGEQGRGFAVVADEVRVLAQRTQTSTEEIQAMIEKLQSGAQQAVEAMNQSRSQADVTRDTAAKAGEVLNNITSSVTNINDMNTLIASAAEEQNAVADEINRNIVNISQGAESVSESAAHTATTSDELRHVAEELKHVVSGLKA